ncbi:methyltransferase domain-containing protein [bacterium]|nr:methyltransferase domain-containing protein [bacterium]
MNEKPIAAGRSSFGLIDTKKLFSELRLQENTIFLDVACGSGAYSIAASEYISEAGRIYAVDLWKEGIDNLKREITTKQLENVYASVADVSKQIPIEDYSVDICLMAMVLHDLIQDNTAEGTLREVQRVLKPQGTLAIIEFKKIAGPHGPPIEIKISPKELEKRLQPYSFRLTKTMDIGLYSYLSVFINQNDE